MLLSAVCCLFCACLLAVSTVVSGDGESLPRFRHDKPASLVLVQMLFRHGDRSPIKSYPKNPVNDSMWPQGFGQLTKIGIQQSFAFGQELRVRYQDFLQEDYNQTQVVVHSTDYDRTLMTAQSILAGLFWKPLVNDTDWPLGGWQPVPIHTQDCDHDQLFAHAPCPRLKSARADWTDSRIPASHHISQYQKLCEKLTAANTTGMTVTLDNLSTLADTIFCEEKHGFRQPAWLTSDVYELLMQFRNESNQFQFVDPEAARLQGGPVLAEMTQNMEMQKSNPDSKAKLFLFSAHDTNVLSLGRVLGIFNNLQPPYLASIIVELHEQQGQHFVKVLFHNHTLGSPFNMSIPGCDTMCPLEQFHTILKDNMLAAADREAACAPLLSGSYLIYILGTIVVTLAAAFIAMVVIVIRLRRRSRESSTILQYRKLLQNDNIDGDTDDDDQEQFSRLY